MPLSGRPATSFVVPESPERPVRVQRSKRVRPPLSEQARIRLAAFRLNECIVIQRTGWVDVVHCRHNVVIAASTHRRKR